MSAFRLKALVFLFPLTVMAKTNSAADSGDKAFSENGNGVNPIFAPQIEVPETENLESWRTAFEQSEALDFGQHWREEPEHELAAGEVRFGWDADAVYVMARLEDSFASNPVTAFNQPAFLEGDVFELFINEMRGEGYFEIHVTPENSLMQLYIPNQEMLKKMDSSQPLAERLGPLYFDREVVGSWVYHQPEEGVWTTVLRVPADWLKGDGGLAEGDRFRFLCGRYDHDPSRETPVLSSTARLSRLSFHHKPDWDTLVLRR